MEQVAKTSISYRAASARITSLRVRAATMTSVLSWSSGATVETCGWRCVGSHIWRVWHNREYCFLADACVNLIRSLELRAAGFTLREVFSPELEAAACRRSTRGAWVRQLGGTGLKCFMLLVDDDTEFRSHNWMCICKFWCDLFAQKVMCKVIHSPRKKIARVPRTPKSLGVVLPPSCPPWPCN